MAGTLRSAGKGALTAATICLESILALLYPPVCAVCDTPMAGGGLRAGFCCCCLSAMPLVREADPPGAAVTMVEAGFPVAAAGEFGGPLRDAIHLLKYSRRDDLARPLAALMGDLVSRLERERGGRWKRSRLLVPVPLHPARERQRGYNQARLLADRLSRRFGIPLAPRRALRRRWRTSSQTGRGADCRRENMRGAFRAGWHKGFEGKRVLLVDDVITTGATLEACAHTLRAAGAGPVTGLVLARTPKRG
jgi:ComF family protein